MVNTDDTTKSTAAPRLHPGDRIFHYNRARRLGIEPPRSFEKSVRRRLTLEAIAGDIDAVHPDVKELRYPCCLKSAAQLLLEETPAVLISWARSERTSAIAAS